MDEQWTWHSEWRTIPQKYQTMAELECKLLEEGGDIVGLLQNIQPLLRRSARMKDKWLWGSAMNFHSARS